MKIITLTLLFILSISTISAQLRLYDGKVTIKPGVPLKKIVKILGLPTTSISIQEEREKWEKSDYDTKKEITFYHNPDSLYEFSPNPYGFWKAFVKNGKITAFIATSFEEENPVNKARFFSNVGFFDKEKQLIEKFKFTPDRKKVESDRTTYLFLEKGVNFLIMENEVRTVIFFKSLKGKEKIDFLKIVNTE